LTALDVSKNTALDRLVCYNNAIPLSDLYAASQKISNPEDKWLGTQRLPAVNAQTNVAVVVDSVFNGFGTVFTVKKNNIAAVPSIDYSLSGGNITFLTAGTYSVEISNSAITSNASVPAIVIANYNVTSSTVPVSGISLDKTSINLSVNATEQLSATVFPSNATNKNVTWISSNTSVIEVNASGLVTAKAAGTATITVTTADGAKTASCAVTVTPSPDAASLKFSSATLDFIDTGGTKTISVTSNVSWTVEPYYASWLTVFPLSGSNNGTVTITAATNTGAARTTPVVVEGGGITDTVYVMQTAAIPVNSLTVSPASLSFEEVGGSQNISVTSNINWTASSSASWATVSPASGSGNGTVSVRATENTDSTRTATIIFAGGGITRTIVVRQDSAARQDVVVNPVNPVNNKGIIELSLSLPTNATFSGSFVVTLPHGFSLDINGSALAGELVASYILSITPQENGRWLFSISLNTLLRSAATYRKIIDIAYAIDESVSAGIHEASITDLVLALSDGEVIREDEIKVSLTADPTGIITPNQEVKVFSSNGILTVNSPLAERIDIYSFNGMYLYSAVKSEGLATFIINNLNEKTLIVRGSSGWVRKIMK
jgi:uncharacterized protein YjdB